jgi:transposase
MTISPTVLGIDISKHHLDVFDPRVGRAERVLNATEAICAWAGERLVGDELVVFEATGRYDQALRDELGRRQVRFSRVNPAKARDFARAAGFLAKTDAIDSRMLSLMGQALRLRPAEPALPERERLVRLHRRRDQLVAMRVQEKTRLKEEDDPDAGASLHDHLDWLNEQIRGFDAAIRQLIADSAELARTQVLLRSVPGVGPVTAASLLALVPELGARSSKTIAALIGLAPLNADSGLWRGKRCIRGGRKRVRDALYMAAVSCIGRRNRFASAYSRLVQAGKPPKLALIAVARRILVTLNAIVRDRQPFHA